MTYKNMSQNIDWQEYTALPLKVIKRVDLIGDVLMVKTPHADVITIETSTVDEGVFKATTQVPKKTSVIITRLRNIEYDAQEYLLEKWVEANQ